MAIEAQACGMNVFVSNTVPSEINCGGVIYIDLSKGPIYWANEIYNLFEMNKNKRIKYSVEKFSFERFKTQLIDLYQQN